MDATRAPASKPFSPLRIVVPVLVALLAVSAYAQWYARSVSLPRYCEDPLGTLTYLERIVADERPAGEGATRPFVVAAKLLFLVPRGADEERSRYLERVRRHLEVHCR
jgi:hypothetical protein